MRANYRSSAYRLIAIQFVISLIIAGAWALKSGHAGYSALLGGFSCALPNALFGLSFLMCMPQREVRQALQLFYLGEFFKMFLSVSFLIISIVLLHAAILPVLTGFLVASIGLVGAKR